MSRRVTCSQDHFLEFPNDDDISPADFPIRCPVCGEVIARTAKDLGDLLLGLKPDAESESESERLPDTDPEIDLPEPAPSGSKFRAPFPADYEVIETLSRGGMGSVFKAIHKKMGRLVALKMHAPPPNEDPAHRARLKERIRAAAMLDHPNLVRVFDVGERDGWLWEAQEFMAGGDLTQLLHDGPLPPWRAVELLAPVALAVQYLHKQGYVHRNLNPRKILLTADGTPKLVDLDLAKRMVKDTSEEVRSGTIIGTPAYMAPEQVRGDDKSIGPATDVYGLGAILYETLTGKPPLQGSSVTEILQRSLSAEPILSPRHLRPEVPRDLETICLKCLEKDPQRRYISAQDLAEALKRLAVDMRGSVPPVLVAVPLPSADTGVCEIPPRLHDVMPAGHALTMAAPTAPAPAASLSEASTGIFAAPPSRPTLPTRRTSPGLWKRILSRVGAWFGAGKAVRDQVDATVFAPSQVFAGQELLVQVFAHLPTQSDQAREFAREFDQQAERRGCTSLELEIAHGERLTFHLTLPGLVIDRPQASLVWRGRPDSVQFGVLVPVGRKDGTVIGTVTASLESIPVGHIKFKLSVVTTALTSQTESAAIGESAQLYRHAFISYASADRQEVLKRVQMLAQLRIRYFQDILDLDPGVRWEKELYRQIDQSDLFLLFWSTSARESKWVLEEVRYALKRKGAEDLAPPEILPIVIEGPPPPEPPCELAHLHFNDYLLYLMQEPGGKH